MINDPHYNLDTISKLLLDHSNKRGNKTANRKKDFGIWQSRTWSVVVNEVRNFIVVWQKKDLKEGINWQ